MNVSIKELTEEIAYKSLEQSNPKLLKIISVWIAHGIAPEQIIDICVNKTKLPRHRLALIGCAADHIIRKAATVTETIQ